MEYNPAMRPGLPTWCCKDCQGVDRRHSAECDRERRHRHPPLMPDVDVWDTKRVEERLRKEYMRSPWPRWISPADTSTLKKETKSDRQRRLDGYCP